MSILNETFLLTIIGFLVVNKQPLYCSVVSIISKVFLKGILFMKFNIKILPQKIKTFFFFSFYV